MQPTERRRLMWQESQKLEAMEGKVRSCEQLKLAVAQLKPGDATVLGIERKGQFQYLAFEME
jgi:hypothetical protein